MVTCDPSEMTAEPCRMQNAQQMPDTAPKVNAFRSYCNQAIVEKSRENRASPTNPCVFSICRRDSQIFQMGMKQSSPRSFETRPSSFIILWVLWRDSGSLERSRLKFLILPLAVVESEFHYLSHTHIC